MKQVAIIPARGGSRRIHGKNIRMFYGKPILAYSIEAAKACKLFDRIFVSSDDPVTMGVAFEYGAEFLQRPEAMARDEIGTQTVTRDALRGMNCKLVCCIYPTAPMLLPRDLQRGYREMRRKDIWFAFAVGTTPLRDAGQFYWSKVAMLRDQAHLYGSHSALIPIDESRVCDINTEDDWRRAEEMYAAPHSEAVLMPNKIDLKVKRLLKEKQNEAR